MGVENYARLVKGELAIKGGLENYKNDATKGCFHGTLISIETPITQLICFSFSNMLIKKISFMSYFDEVGTESETF